MAGRPKKNHVVLNVRVRPETPIRLKKFAKKLGLTSIYKQKTIGSIGLLLDWWAQSIAQFVDGEQDEDES